MPENKKKKLRFNLGLNAKLVLIFILFSLLPIAIVGFVSVSRTSEELTKEATTRLKSFSKSEAEKINLSLSKIGASSKNLAEFATNVYDHPAFFYHSDYWSTDSLFEGPQGQYGNLANETTSIIVFNWYPLDEQVKRDLTLASALDFVFPSVKEENPNIDNLYIIGGHYGWYRLYPNSDPDLASPGGFAMDILPANLNESGVDPVFWDDLDETHNPEKKTKWTPPYVDVTGHGLMISALSPVYQADKMTAITGVDITLEDITNRILDIKLWKTGYAFMIDKEARLISSPVQAYKDLEWKKEKLEITEIREYNLLDAANPELRQVVGLMKAGEQGLKTVKFDGVKKYVAYYPIEDTGWSLGLVVPINEVIASALTTRNFILIVLSGLAIILLILIFLCSRLVTAPIKKLTKGAEEISQGNLSYQIKVRTGDEIGQLAENFNQMAFRLKVYYATLEQKVKDRTKELAVANEKLIIADQIKSQFVSLASHQLRTPATIIKWGTEILLKTMGEKITEKEKEQVQRIYRGSQRMVELVNDLLNVSRLESGRLIFKVEEKQLEEMIDSVVKEYQPYLEKKNTKLVVEKPLTPLAKVNIDEEKIRQVIIILLDNAIKYSPEGSEIKIKVEQRGEEILYQTKDRGVGIPKNQQNQIFTRFFRADNVSQKPGTGLGLFLAKGLVEACNGKIWFESEEEKGAVFYFTLPVSGSKKAPKLTTDKIEEKGLVGARKPLL